MRGSKAPSKTEIIEGPDAQELDDSNEEMDEGEVKAMLSAPPPVEPKEATPNKDDTEH